VQRFFDNQAGMIGRAIIATHHKTGTVWMSSIFRELAKHLTLPFNTFNPQNAPVVPLVTRAPGIIQDQHSRWFELNALSEQLASDRIFHLIRDPRDVIISGMHYHRVSKEAWLHQPDEKFGGLTYQQKLNSFSDDTARYLFEMSQLKAIGRMLAWPGGRPDCFECRYEDLIVDRSGDAFLPVIRHLGFDEAQSALALKIYQEKHIFRDEGRESMDRDHVRSGAARQWPAVFDRTLATAFIDRFGDALVRLGYETDNAWADRL
jgi:hypothetical protein